MSPLAAPALKEAALLSLADGEVAIQLPAGHRSRTRVERRRAEIEAVFARYFGRPTRLVVNGAARCRPRRPPARRAAGALHRAGRGRGEAARARRAVRDAARSHPNIREAAKILDGGIDEIEEL